MYKVHGFLMELDGPKMVINRRMEHIPRIGDTVRLDENQYAKVTEVIWCLDEVANEETRVNIRMDPLLAARA